jgi:excisionase family DNA binding protein
LTGNTLNGYKLQLTSNVGKGHMTDGLLTIDEVADYLAVPKGTLYKWRAKNYGPPAIQVGKHLRYRMTEVETWVEERKAAS